MPEKEIELLKEQIDNLNVSKFDLEAWKIHTLVILTKLFGESSEYAHLVRNLHYDYSSWNLRDTLGATKSADPVRSKARDILEGAIHELEVFGKPEMQESPEDLPQAFRDELTGRETKELKTILQLPVEERRNALQHFISSLDKEVLASILVEILLTP